MRRDEILRQEKELMTHYITAHDSGDTRKKSEVMEEIKKNVERRRIAK